MFTQKEYIILIGSAVLIFIILLIIASNKTGALLGLPLMQASNATQFKPTFFEIYERSIDETACNRLVIVQPFKWHIWAINGRVYLLNESNKSCPINYTPAVVVPATKSDDLSNQVFKDVCINKVFNDIVTSYTDTLKPIIVDFEIEELQAQKNKFTILDALNFLFTKYLTMDPETQPPPSEQPVVKNDTIEMRHIRYLNREDLRRTFSHETIPHYKKQKLNKVINRMVRVRQGMVPADSH